MQFSAIAVAAALVGAVSAGYYNGTEPVYVTEVHTAYTTYCPYATTLTYGEKTYTVTEVSFFLGEDLEADRDVPSIIRYRALRSDPKLILKSSLTRPAGHHLDHH
jgi:hypothetical protein